MLFLGLLPNRNVVPKIGPCQFYCWVSNFIQKIRKSQIHIKLQLAAVPNYAKALLKQPKIFILHNLFKSIYISILSHLRRWFLKKNFWGGNNSKKSENCVGGPKSGITKFGNFWKGLVRKGLCHADFTQWEWGGATKHSGMGINFRDYVLSNMSLTSKLHFSDL